MKKLYPALFAMAAVLAIAPAAFAGTISFDTSGNGIAEDLTLTTGSLVSPGVYNITAISGTFSDANIGLATTAINGIVPDNGSLQWVDTVEGYAWDYVSPDGQENYDNYAYIPGDPLLLDATGGILFTVPDSTYGTLQVSVAGVNGGYDVWINVLGTGNFIDNGDTGEMTTVTPEPGSLLLLGTGLLGLAFLAFRKAKTSGLVLHP